MATQPQANAAAVEEVAEEKAEPEVFDLPTSDESEALLRVRHSVSELHSLTTFCWGHPTHIRLPLISALLAPA